MKIGARVINKLMPDEELLPDGTLSTLVALELSRADPTRGSG